MKMREEIMDTVLYQVIAQVLRDLHNPNLYLGAKVENETPLPAKVVTHEIFGLVEHTDDLPNRFASQGYDALSPDPLPEL